MRIAHVTDFYLPRLGGIEMQVSDLARRQAALGHDVTVITSSPSTAGTRDEPGVTVVRVTDALLWPNAYHPLALASAARAALDGGYDVVHAHVGTASPIGFWSARRAVRAGIPTVVTVHSLWAWAHPIFRAVDMLFRFSRQQIRWTAVSEAAAAPVQRAFCHAPSVTVLPNGIDPDRWHVRPLPRDPDEVVLVAVMRLAVRKRPLPLLRMLQEVREQVPADVRLRAVIVGDGSQRSVVERHLRRYGLTDWVELPGRQTRDEIRDLYRRADVFVAPADLESFGIAALEARSAGVPVVAKTGTGIGEFVANGLDGLLADTDAGMVGALVRLCGDADLRTALAAHARLHPGPVTWARTLALTDEAYRQAAVLVGRPVPVEEIEAEPEEVAS